MVSAQVYEDIGIKQISHNNNIGSLTHTSPRCSTNDFILLFCGTIVALMALLSSGVIFVFLFLEVFFVVLVSIILCFKTVCGKDNENSEISLCHIFYSTNTESIFTIGSLSP